MALPRPIDVAEEVCRDYRRSSKLEWLLGNGTGGFAMGTVAGANTRRYHGLLVASLHPPVERMVTLSRLEETLLQPGGAVPLSVNQYPGTLYPSGHLKLSGFRWDGGPVWTWLVGGVEVERRVMLVPGAQTVVVRYAATAPVRLRVEPLLAFRDYHGLAHRNGSAWTGFEERVDGATRLLRFQPYASLPSLWVRHQGSAFAPGPTWHENVEYLEELERGLDFREDLLLPGHWELELAPGQPQLVAATMEGPEAVDLSRVAQLFERPVLRGGTADPRPRLARAAEVYPARRADGSATILAGYPWFTDWGRDTMISLPGLLVARGQLDLAREVLEGFLAHLDGGLVPNRFPDSAGPAEYNTADATLFMFQAVQAWLTAGGSRDFLKVFYPAGCAIVEAHQRGTHHGIRVDPSDGLLVAGDAGSNLTWMDARVNGVPVTPRHGKPVEVNALWYNALRFLEAWAHEVGDAPRAAAFGREASRVQASFDRAFWNEARRCCFDVLLPEGPDGRLRPNQLFALGLPFPLLDVRRRELVLSTVEGALLTPVGLRTLARADPGYRPAYRGGPAERDAAYHQGLVWPWLLGPYADALLAVRGDSPASRVQVRNALAGVVERMDTGCLEQLPECFEPEPPFRAVGAPAQAWSVAEPLRILARLDVPSAPGSSRSSQSIT
jgi:predicted glycogen debranching enzyme